MRLKVTFVCVFIWFICGRVTTIVIKNNCSDCIGYKSCPAAVVATDMALYPQLDNADCGLDDAELRKICCAKLTAAVEIAMANTLHYHPNVLLLSDNCGIGEEDGYADKIAGGVPVLKLYEYPWMVFISYKTPEGIQFLCAGSLINERYVLTSARCLTGHVFSVRIRVYEHLDCQGASFGCEASIQDRLIEEAIPHPGYVHKPLVIRNDIGLLRLENPVNLSFILRGRAIQLRTWPTKMDSPEDQRRLSGQHYAEASPFRDDDGTICLPVTPSMRHRNIVGQPATVAHREQSEESYESATLLYVNVSVHTAQYCWEQYKRVLKDREGEDMVNKICSSADHKGPCIGFAGAPLMVWDRFGDRDRFIQYGIVSTGDNRCGILYPKVYTDVTKYMVWILNTIKP